MLGGERDREEYLEASIGTKGMSAGLSRKKNLITVEGEVKYSKVHGKCNKDIVEEQRVE